MDLVLNNLQRLICHKTQQTQTQTIQFSISMQFISIKPIDATIPGQSEPGSNVNEGVLRIPKSPRITGTSPLDCLVS